MPDETQVTLRYFGPDVDDGSIGVDDLLSALNGFSSAFYRVAERENPDSRPRIKVTGISQSSANIHLAILEIAAHPRVAAAVSGAAAYLGKKLVDVVIDRISSTAKAKKHIQSGSFTEVAVEGDNNQVLIINNLNVPLPVELLPSD